MFKMPTFPIITHERADSVIAWRDGRPVSAARFLSDVAQLSARFPAGMHVLNVCNDRYRFTVGLAATLLSNKVSLLPSTLTPEMIRQLLQFAPDTFCLADSKDCAIALPQLQYPTLVEDVPDWQQRTFSVPEIDSAQLVAYVFTSGSTGVPIPHRKTWGSLVRDVQAEAQLCGLNDGRQHAIVGTVPSQHMYGFESTVLLVMQSANALVACQSFYPADICNAVNATPRPRALVSTPFHLRAVINAGLEVPAVDLVVSATAPLSITLAAELEAAFQSRLLEIYGSTETGQIATRHTTQTQEWELFPDVRFNQQEGVTWARGGHVEQPMPMNDVIECISDTRFLLHGRNADLINIAGKRNSLANLNRQLNEIPGVVDGAFYMPDDTGIDDVTRLAAVVVAPAMSAAALLAALRERVDAVFLPRPLIFVDALPRTAAGKLPRETLQALTTAKPAAQENSA